ncbi:serine hydrolase domain-containing protein [Kribbella sp. NBC_00889]|uniref:serine hydrolase domain-containing protein n=1 Tax=Kribbella sp. NBC_00889 TaxID=2975974 RepID=UPI00386B876A|nr:beta-lactamase family protein [Kribbella sp. NBC_00889]
MNSEVAQRIAEEVAAKGKMPGLSFAVAGPEGLLYAGTVGYADLAERRESTVDDQYPWFSMTKIATATAVVRLHVNGKLDLDTPIGTYLPGYRPSAKSGHPTTRQLLTHTAGLANPLPIRWVRPEGDREDPALLDRIVRKHGSPRRAVGGRAAYSNIGYLLAGKVIEAVTGESVQDHVHRSVLEPLGMKNTGYEFQASGPRSIGYVRLNPAAVPVLRWALPSGIVGNRVAGHTALRPFLVSGPAYGGLVGTVTDAALLAAAHSAGLSDHHPLLPYEQVEAMRTISAPGKPFDHGIGWFRPPAGADRTPAYVEHYGTGCGFWNAMRIYPHRRLAMVAMTNTTFRWEFDNLFTRLEQLRRDSCH